jgi:radical SAM-linked protein
MDALAEIERKHELLKATLGSRRNGVKLRTHDGSASVLEGILARGDRRLAAAIEHAWRNGARFDSWDEQLRLELWNEAFAHTGIDTDVYLRTLPVTARLPWDHIDVGLEDGFLLREYRKALQDRLSPPCGKVAGAFVHHDNLAEARADERLLVCYDCGVACDMSAMRTERLVHLERLGVSPPRDEVIQSSDPHAGQRYRFQFEKTGPVALLGHLDLVRELPRVLRRVGVSPVYTTGFHPRPQMSFCPALPLGVMSLDEYVDVRLAGDIDLAELCARMNDASPSGLTFLGARRLSATEPAISKLVHGARYLFAFASSLWDDAQPPPDLGERCQALLAAEHLEVQRRVKGIGRRIDLRGYLRRLAPLPRAFADTLLARAGITGRMSCVEAEVNITPNGAARPSEIAQLLFGGDASPPHRCVRVETFRAQPVDQPIDQPGQAISPGP